MNRFNKWISFTGMKVLVVTLTIATTVSAEDRRLDKSNLTIMTLNAEFLWDGVAPEEGQVDIPWKHSQTEAEEHMRKVSELIIRGNPDIINLVEIENLNALTVLNDKFLAGRGYKPFLVQGKDNYTGQDVALLTRIDPESMVYDNREGQSSTVRKTVSKNYVARINASNMKLAFIGLHFLAQPLREDRRLQREAQAAAIQSMALENKDLGFQVVVLGDFNDYDGAEDSKDHIDSTPVTNVLSTIKSMSPGDAADDLVNMSSFLPKAIRYTAFYDANDNNEVDPPNEFTSIDHILLSPLLAEKVTTVEVPHDHDPRQVTDHFPVLVHLKLEVGTSPTTTSQLKIASLLPNPSGNENQNEEATISNSGSQAVSLAGWKLRDLAGKTWDLDELGNLQPGESKTIKRNGKPMAMNNDGDTIDLIDPQSQVMHTITYERTDEGELIVPVN